MTNIAHWSGNYSTSGGANEIAFDSTRTVAATQATGADGLWVASPMGSGTFVFEFTSNASGFDIGIINAADLPSHADPPNGVMIRQNGNIESFTASVYTLLGTASGWVNSAKTQICYNGTSKKIWFTQDGVAFWGYNGTSVVSCTAAQVSAGTNGVPCAMVTNPYPYAYLFGAGGGTTITLNSSAPYLNSNPTGFGDLPATLFMGVPDGNTSSPVTLPWTSGRTESGLTYFPDGSVTGTACAGGTSGASGTATGPTYGSTGLHTIMVQSNANTLDATGVQPYFVYAPQAGVGVLLAEWFITSPPDLNDNVPITLPGGPYYGVIFDAGYADVSGVVGNGGLIFKDTGGVGQVQTVFDAGGNISQGYYTINPTTGTNTIAGTGGVGPIQSVVGTLNLSLSGTQLVGSGNVTLSITGTSSTGTWAPGTVFQTIASGIPFNTVTPNTGHGFGTAKTWGRVYSIPSETLTIATESYISTGGGTVTTAGLDIYGTLTTLATAIDGGTFALATSLSTTVTGTSTSYTATLAGSLSAGTHTVQNKNVVSGVVSNLGTLVVLGPPTLTLSSASYLPGTISASGTDYNEGLTTLQLSLDSAAYVSATSLGTTGSLPTIAFSTTLSAGLEFGPHTLQAKNATTGTISNVETFNVVEGITLSALSGVLADNIPLTGVSNSGPPASLDVYMTLNGTLFSNWSLVAAYSTGGGYINAAWSGYGPELTNYGTYVVTVRDHVYPYIISNSQTLVLADPVPGCADPLPSPSLGRYRGAVGINFYGKTLIGDAFSGVVGEADFDNFTEYGNTMRALVTTPPVHKDRRRVFVPRFEIDVESGVGLPNCLGSDPSWSLDISKDGGRTFGPVVELRAIGRIGEYLERLRWLRLGQARQWIFRLQSTDPVRRVIIGTYLDMYEGMGGTGGG